MGDNLEKSWKNIDQHFANCLRDPWYSAIFQLSACIFSEVTRYFESIGYLSVLAPITAHSISSPMGLGSDSEPVKVDLFNKSTYLADSMQFHLEYLLRLHRKGVYYIMPTFRGEASDERHLNEFFHIEAELTGDLERVVRVVEELLVALVGRILSEHTSTIHGIGEGVEHLEQLMSQRECGFKRVSFDEAVNRLNGDERSFNRLGDIIIGITPHGERRLISELGEPLWLMHLPRLGAPFYQADRDDHHSTCADLLMGIGELVGCGERHSTEDETRAGMALRQVDHTPYKWYLRLKREYPMATAGFGMGLERLLLWVLKHDDIRDTQIFVRQRDIYGIP